MFKNSFLLAFLGLTRGFGDQRHSDVATLDGRIVGGSPAFIEKFPHQVSVQENGWHNCGGSILNPITILTAAHCIEVKAKSLSIRAASTYHHEGGQIVKVKEIHIHPLYVIAPTDYDICVLKLKKDIVFGPKAKAIKLPNSGDPPAADVVSVIAGWGAISEGGPGSYSLQYVELPIVSQEDCTTAYGGNPVINERVVCAGVLNDGGRSACKGDSGGALIQNGVQIGISSWGFGCGKPGFPGVYANVAYYREFIVQFL